MSLPELCRFGARFEGSLLGTYTCLGGRDTFSKVATTGSVAMHESLSLGRFSAGWVQALLPFGMPRVL